MLLTETVLSHLCNSSSPILQSYLTGISGFLFYPARYLNHFLITNLEKNYLFALLSKMISM
ncbi:MAG: hypothetical protein CVU39_18525 [Chloroflexi bacterium HGW-Chloroflexi-10]|nr:MAG: hypothetical protein CVU39_18525 [Chloroflexi bacterium HGW-Chloroflexi-10]